MSVENPYAAPLADLSQSAADQPMFFVVAPRKLLLMVLLSQGLYMVYWSYKQWAYYRQATGARIWPWARGFFAVFFFYSFAMKVRRKLELTNTSHRWWPRCLALAMILSALLPQAYVWFVAPMTALKLNVCLLIVYAALTVQLQRAVNRVEDDMEGNANHRLTWANGIWILIGTSFWALTTFLALNPPGPY